MAEVFASVVSYRDPRVVATVDEVLAEPGMSVRIGAVLQDDDTSAAEVLAKSPEVDVISMPSAAARGPSWARAVAATLYEGEPWYYTTDAHMHHEPGWATELARQAALVGPQSVLSSYVHAHDQRIGDRACVVGIQEITPNNGIRGHGVQWPIARFGGYPAPARRLSLHHMWAPGRWVQEVPIDPQLYYWAEEQTLAIRLWTNGWDLYHPCKGLARHMYGRENRGRHWEDQPRRFRGMHAHSERRMRALYGWDEAAEPFGIYGLGSERARAQFERYAGIDLAERTFLEDEAWRTTLGDPDLSRHPNYCHVPGALTSEQLRRLHQTLETSEVNFARAGVGNGGDDDTQYQDEKRRCEIAWLYRCAGWGWLHEALWRAGVQANERVWRMALASQANAEDMQLARYEAGGHYDWHPDKSPQSKGRMSCRALSVVVLLREAEAGGGLAVDGRGVIEMEPGDALVFPATVRHRAVPVERGQRESLVLWLHGAPPGQFKARVNG